MNQRTRLWLGVWVVIAGLGVVRLRHRHPCPTAIQMRRFVFWDKGKQRPKSRKSFENIAKKKQGTFSQKRMEQGLWAREPCLVIKLR